MRKTFPKVYEYEYKFGKTKEELLPIAVGIGTVSFDNDESTEDYQYLDGKGVAETDINGQKVSWTFEGHRELNDELQKLIFSEMLFDTTNRNGYFEVTGPDGSKISGDATVVDIVPMGGEAAERNEASFTVVLAGKPEVTKGE